MDIAHYVNQRSLHPRLLMKMAPYGVARNVRQALARGLPAAGRGDTPRQGGIETFTRFTLLTVYLLLS